MISMRIKIHTDQQGAREVRKEVIGNATLYADSLARKNSEALSFIPKPRLEQYAANGQLMIAIENGEPCGFLLHGNGWPVMRIYQSCIQYDARRREHGFKLIALLIGKAAQHGYEAICLKCAADLEANAFWREAGFRFIRAIPGGTRRGRTLNVWYMPLPLIENAQRQGRLIA